MATSFIGWANSWGNSWGGVEIPPDVPVDEQISYAGKPKKKRKTSDAFWFLTPTTQKKLEAIAPEVAQVIEAQAAEKDGEKIKQALSDLGIAYQLHYTDIYNEIMREIRAKSEEDETAQIAAMMLMF